MILTAGQLCDEGQTPCDFYDANGMVIYRKITEVDTETGRVVSFVCHPNGEVVLDWGPEGHMDTVERTEFYPAPLTYKKLTQEQLKVSDARLWDREGK